jgi:hypothetical protein
VTAILRADCFLIKKRPNRDLPAGGSKPRRAKILIRLTAENGLLQKFLIILEQVTSDHIAA